MFYQRYIICFVLILALSSSNGARKTKRPLKPGKTYPRTNTTPQPPGTSTSVTLTDAMLSSITPKTASALTASAAAAAAASASATTLQLNKSDTNPSPISSSTPSSSKEFPRPVTTATSTNSAINGGSAGASAIAAELKADIANGVIEEECDPDMIGFEIITGYVLSAPSKLLSTLPGTLMLTDCLEACQSNESCSAVNFETGLCVLFKATADKLPGSLSRSQFPVFTIYAQKSCLGVRPCSKAWCIDRVQGYRLSDYVKSSQTVLSRRDCLELCLGETEFICRSANFYHHSGLCELSDMSRLTLSGNNNVEMYDGADYLENNCAEEPNKLCEFKRISGKILKTVDSVYQDINSIEECRDLCLNSPYRCHSYDYNDTGDMVCRLSHHSRATLTDVNDPYLDVAEAATYELSSCYNVSIECRSGEMITKIRTSKLFDGKVYAKGSPKSCSVNVNNSLEFDFRMGYNDIECNVRQSANGRYMNDIVIQHHDMIVTSSDLGLAVSCQYDLTNKTVSNDVDLGVTGEIESSLSEEIIIESPNVIMKITSRDGSDMKRIAEVGDPLALRFEIVEPNSPYEIFVRELVAMDGSDNAEITLIDADGCPTDQYIMGAIQKLTVNPKVLLSQFDAFKFPSSEVVQFRALVTPCIPRCEPVICDGDDNGGSETKSLMSYGRRRRRSVSNETKASDENILLVQSIQITDKFGFNPNAADTSLFKNEGSTSSTLEDAFACFDSYGIFAALAIFLLAQVGIILIWKIIQRRTKKERFLYQPDMASSMAYGSQTPVYGQPHGSNACDDLGKLYDSGIIGRYGQQF